MKEGWEYKRLIDICDVYQPKTISTSKLVNNGSYYVYGANGIIGKYINFNHEESEVLLTCRGASCGNINVSKPKSWINGNAMVIHPLNEKITKEYLSYYLKVIDYSKVITGAAQPQITRSSLSDTFILYPSIDEQRRIVSYLDSSFKLIDEIKEKAQKSLSEAKALFQSALAEAMEPKERWEEKTLGDVCILIRGPFGGSLKKECFTREGYAVYEQQNAIYNQFTFRYFIDEDKYNEMARFKVKAGDLIMSCSGTIGKVAIIPDNYQNGIINQALLKLTPLGILNSYFLKYLMESKIFLDKLLVYTEGVAIKNVASVSVLKGIQINIPNISTQNQIVSHLDKLSSNVKQMEERYKKMVEECDALKQAMLRDVFE